MGVTNDIHWLDLMILIGLCLLVWGVWSLINAAITHREIQKKIDQDKEPYDWEGEGW
jgi:hypothetical protein